jgi:hypothetical protein
MAENRGGYRPTAPQNNYGVSATGGNGSSAATQAARYVSGLPFGQGKQTLAQQRAVPMAGTPAAQAAAAGAPAGAPASMGEAMPQPGPSVVPLTEPTQRPNEPITAGIDMGPGPGSSVLGMPQQAEQTGLQNALNLLNQLGDGASTQVKSIRNALEAHISNNPKG